MRLRYDMIIYNLHEKIGVWKKTIRQNSPKNPCFTHNLIALKNTSKTVSDFFTFGLRNDITNYYTNCISTDGTQLHIRMIGPEKAYLLCNSKQIGKDIEAYYEKTIVQVRSDCFTVDPSTILFWHNSYKKDGRKTRIEKYSPNVWWYGNRWNKSENIPKIVYKHICKILNIRL